MTDEKKKATDFIAEVVVGQVEEPDTGDSPEEALVNWAQKQPQWVQALVSRALETGKAVEADELAHVVELLMVEEGIAEGTMPDAPDLAAASEAADPGIDLKLHDVRDIHNVNALSDGAGLGFGAQLTLVFGENGSGKTGISRVIKRAAGEQHAESILHNVRDGEPKGDPSADFNVQQGENEPTTITWRNEVGLDPLHAIRVFDSTSVVLHVDKELNYSLVPAGLKLFEFVVDGLEDIQARLAGELEKWPQLPTTLADDFSDGTPVCEAVKQLANDPSLDTLKSFDPLNEGEEASLDANKVKLAGLNVGTINQTLGSGRDRLTRLRAVKVLCDAAIGFDPVVYKSALDELTAAEEELRNFRTGLFEAAGLEGEPDGEWEEFIAAGERYREHAGLDHDPVEGEQCIYCKQDLSPEARELIANYTKFFERNLTDRITQAEQALAKAALIVPNQELSAVSAWVTDQLDINAEDELLKDVKVVVDELTSVLDSIENRTAVDAANLNKHAGELEPKVAQTISNLTDELAQLEIDKGDLTTARTRTQDEIAPLQDRKTLAEKLPAIEESVVAAGTRDQIEKVIKAISSAQRRSLTDASKAATETLMNDEFKTCFEAECKALRTPDVTLDFPGEDGATRRKKTVATGFSPSTVLSEGEMKSLALADFLAENAMSDQVVPLVFDDPVSSLDHRRTKEVAARLVDLSNEQQVVIFTHNVWFAAELLELAGKYGCEYLEVASTGGVSGVVQEGVNPRHDSPEKIEKKIKNLLNEKPDNPTAEAALAATGYAWIRAWCEAFVEQKLFANVVQRFRDNIMLTKLGEVKGSVMEQAAAVIDPINDKASEYIEAHASTMGQAANTPTFEELQEDFDTLMALKEATK